nr:PREDICTED: protein maestro-like isoform X1 [Apteryx mantelli mantelli]
MKDQVVEESELLKPLLEALVERSCDPVSTVWQVAMRGVGNGVSGAPTKLQRRRVAMMEVLLRGLEDVTDVEVAVEGLLVLVKVLGLLEARAKRSAFKDITRSTRLFLRGERKRSCTAWPSPSTARWSPLPWGGGPFSAERWRKCFPALCCISGRWPRPSATCARSLCISTPCFGGRRGCCSASLQALGLAWLSFRTRSAVTW